ncbi:hypothetical protein BKA67DRAFT_568359 [Truncatella angustata]|uniref:NmrA-like domain-containing protein n=1 Tax=Truncatella angustata TaxID=152316 RepID=A0A9P8UJ11_9PEZI|nr:uncharacterized protein BKA67DRAFT_568359 [Truncatella angustata]KAH6653016.1 hypothetical protein BKA67DRAFT_568359 [Truncatella angustata]KAH8199886.1 hypothetical protein TruAng_005942 [Truncatella angustata]
MVKVFVAGATGKQGGAATRSLLAQGHEVHAYVRDITSSNARTLEQAGAKLFAGDWDTLPSLKTAMKGCDAVFFPPVISWTDLKAEERWNANILGAAEDSGTVKHVVYSTVSILAVFDQIQKIEGWDEIPMTAHFFNSKVAGESAVRKWAQADESLVYSILRPSGFMTNYVTPWASLLVPDLIKQGVWHTSLPTEFPLGLIDPEDIGRVVAQVIENPSSWKGSEVEVNAENLSVGTLVEYLSEASGRSLKAQNYTKEEVEKLAKVHPVVNFEQLRLKVTPKEGFNVTDWKVAFRFNTFKQFLEDNRDLVAETYKNVHEQA